MSGRRSKNTYKWWLKVFHKGIDYKECNGGYSLLRLRFLTTSLTGFEYEGGCYSIQKSGRIFAYFGYWYDGPSGPTIDTENSMEGSCFHDIIYDMIKKGIIPNTYWNRRKADKMLYKSLRKDKMNWFRAQLWYWGVRGGGSFHV